MKLYHITKKGTLHFQLSNGRLAAVYPSTGYVRVSQSLDGFVDNRFKVNLLKRFNKVVEEGNPGNVNMWPINKRVTATTRYGVNRELFYEINGRMYKYPHEVFFEAKSRISETHPGDIVKLMDLLTAFEAKNC